MKMLQDVTDWFKAEILGDQSLPTGKKEAEITERFREAY